MVNAEHRYNDLVWVAPRRRHGFETFDTHIIVQEQPHNRQEEASISVINKANKNISVYHIMRSRLENTRAQETGVQSSYYKAAIARLPSLFLYILLGDLESPQEPLDRKVEMSDINTMWEVWFPT